MSIKDADDAVQAALTIVESLALDLLVLAGDHEMIPSTPAVCIYPLSTQREYVGAPRRIEALIGIELMVYHGALTSRGEQQQKATTLVRELVDGLEADNSFGGDNLIIDVLVTRNDYGEAVKGRSQYFASRITLQLTSRYNIGVDYG